MPAGTLPADGSAGSGQTRGRPDVSTEPGITLGRGWYPRSRLHRILGSFRQWRRSRPFWAGLWCILGGLEIASLPARSIRLLLVTNGNVAIGIAVGVGIALMGLFLWLAPSQRQVAGVVAALLSVVSLITSTFGGLLIGLILGTVGGAMGFAWTPQPSRTPLPSPLPTDTPQPGEEPGPGQTP